MQTDLAFSCAPGDPKLVTKGCMLQVFSGNAIRLGAKHIDLDLFIIYWAVFFLYARHGCRNILARRKEETGTQREHTREEAWLIFTMLWMWKNLRFVCYSSKDTSVAEKSIHAWIPAPQGAVSWDGVRKEKKTR